MRCLILSVRSPTHWAAKGVNGLYTQRAAERQSYKYLSHSIAARMFEKGSSLESNMIWTVHSQQISSSKVNSKQAVPTGLAFCTCTRLTHWALQRQERFLWAGLANFACVLPTLLNAMLNLSVQTDLHNYMRKGSFHSVSCQTIHFQAC